MNTSTTSCMHLNFDLTFDGIALISISSGPAGLQLLHTCQSVSDYFLWWDGCNAVVDNESHEASQAEHY